MNELINYKLALFHDGGPVSGTSTYFYNIYRNLKVHDVQCDLYQYLAWKPQIEVDKNIKILPSSRVNKIPKSDLLRKMHTAIDLTYGFNWKAFLENIEADIFSLSNPSLLKLTRYYKNVIAIAHDLYYMHENTDSSILNRYFKRQYQLFKTARNIITNSKFTKSELVQLLDLNEGDISVVYPYVNKDIFYPLARGHQKANHKLNEKLILSVGSDQPNKNIENVILTLKNLPDNYKLIRVGNITYTRKLIDDLNLSKRISTYNNLSAEELANIYRNADILLFPSLHEGFGSPVVEAMASGTPVVTSDRGSLPEVVGNAGIIVDPLEPKKIADRILELTTDDKMNEELICKGLMRAEDFTREKQFSQILAVLQGNLQ